MRAFVRSAATCFLALAGFLPAWSQVEGDWLDRAVASHWKQASVAVAEPVRPEWAVHVGPGLEAVATLEDAQQAVRGILADIRAGRKPARQVVVRISPGTYALTKPLRLGTEDGGDEKFPVIWMAEVPGRTMISGGITMQPVPEGNGRLRYDLPAGVNVDWTLPHQLFIDSRSAVLAREPNVGSFWHVQPPKQRNDKSTLFADPRSLQFLRALSPEDRARAELFLYHSWTTSMHRFTVEGDSLKFGVPSKWSPLQFWGPAQRYFVDNVAAALDSPGEWIGNGRSINYIPRPEDSSGPRVATLPLTQRLIEIAGTSTAQVGWITFSGLQFQFTELAPNVGNFVDAQAGVTVGAAIDISHARHIVIRNSEFAHLGAYAIWMRDDVAYSTIDRNVIKDTAGGGVKLGGIGRSASPELDVRMNTVTNNVVARTGRVFPGSVGLWIGWGSNNRLEHNLIAETTYTGVSVGWKWGFGGPSSQGNRINHNVLFDIGRGHLADLGGIYTLGESPGTEIVGNLIREVRSFENYGVSKCLGAFGIYLDEGSSSIRVADNVVVGTDCGGLHINYGRDNLVVRNVFAGGAQKEITVFHDKGGKTIEMRGNSLFPLTAAPFQGELTARNGVFVNNLLGQGSLDRVEPGVCGEGCAVRASSIQAGSALMDIRVTNAATADATIRKVAAEAGPKHLRDVLVGLPVAVRRPELRQPNSVRER